MSFLEGNGFVCFFVCLALVCQMTCGWLCQRSLFVDNRERVTNGKPRVRWLFIAIIIWLLSIGLAPGFVKVPIGAFSLIILLLLMAGGPIAFIYGLTYRVISRAKK